MNQEKQGRLSSKELERDRARKGGEPAASSKRPPASDADEANSVVTSRMQSCGA
jgi:hypothetical protein